MLGLHHHFITSVREAMVFGGNAPAIGKLILVEERPEREAKEFTRRPPRAARAASTFVVSSACDSRAVDYHMPLSTVLSPVIRTLREEVHMVAGQ